MESKAALFAVGLLVLIGCPEARAPKDVGAELERQVKERVERDRPITGAPNGVAAPSRRSPDSTRLSAASGCEPKQAIPLFTAVAPNVCFGQTPSEVSQAWNKVPLDLATVDTRQVSAVALGDPDSPFSRVSFEFDSGLLGAVVLEPVNGGPMRDAIGGALTAALGKPTTYDERSTGSDMQVIFATTYWYEEGAVRAYFRRSGQAAEAVTIWRPSAARDALALQRYKALIAADNARKAAAPKEDPNGY